jgi:hypothetical protein
MLEARFPLLTQYVATSPATTNYNCIAWACGDNTRWWWPDSSAFWPSGIRCDETVEAFDALFASGGAFEVDTEDLEDGVVKIALFAQNGKPTHAARQLRNGRWTSKLGTAVDIAHSLRELEGAQYGAVVKLYGVRIPP